MNKTKLILSFVLSLIILTSCFMIGTAATEGEHVHSYTIQSEKAPTCTSSGEIVYVCECGDTYTEYTEPLGHKMTHVEAVEPTCEKAGSREHWHCETCGLDFADENGDYTIDKDDIKLDKLSHMITQYSKNKKATCFEDGSVAGTKCALCGKVFKAPEIIKKKTFGGIQVKKFTKGFVVSWTRDKTATGSEVVYSAKKTFSSAKKIRVKNSKNYLKIKKLKSKKTYYVKVRAYKKSGKKTLYSNWTKTKSVKTK